jgi:hypothetical protein
MSGAGPTGAARGQPRYDSLFVCPHADDVVLACPARLVAETERGRRVLALALYERLGAEVTPAATALRDLGADFVTAGLAAPAENDHGRPTLRLGASDPDETEALFAAAQVLVELGPRSGATHLYAPLGLGESGAHRIAHAAALRAFASDTGRNLYLYEERPEAFVPGAVRTRLAALGARLPPAAAAGPEPGGLLLRLWRLSDPWRLRGEGGGLKRRLRSLRPALREWRRTRAWNPLRSLGPRLQPILHSADEETRDRVRAAVEAVLPRDRRGQARAARRFHALASAAARRFGAAYHAERLWLLLPSGEGLPELRHPLEAPESWSPD